MEYFWSVSSTGSRSRDYAPPVPQRSARRSAPGQRLQPGIQVFAGPRTVGPAPGAQLPARRRCGAGHPSPKALVGCEEILLLRHIRVLASESSGLGCPAGLGGMRGSCGVLLLRGAGHRPVSGLIAPYSARASSGLIASVLRAALLHPCFERPYCIRTSSGHIPPYCGRALSRLGCRVCLGPASQDPLPDHAVGARLHGPVPDHSVGGI